MTLLSGWFLMRPWPWHGESSDFTEGVLDLLASGTEALAPAIWPLELVNALLMAERRKRITVAQVTALLRRIAGLPISIDALHQSTRGWLFSLGL
jgi:hypothetical protein